MIKIERLHAAARATWRGLCWFRSTVNWQEVADLELHCLVILVVAIWVAGRTARQDIDTLSRWLATAWVRLWVAPEPSSERQAGVKFEVQLLLPAARPVAGLLLPAPVIAPAGPTAEELMALTVRELMTLTGTRRKLSKRALVEIAMA